MLDKTCKTWKLTPDQRQRLVWRYREGERVKTIAADYKVSDAYVSQLVRRRGHERRQGRKFLFLLNGKTFATPVALIKYIKRVTKAENPNALLGVLMAINRNNSSECL